MADIKTITETIASGSYNSEEKFLKNDEIEEKSGFHRLDEEEKYKKMVKSREEQEKKWFIGFGKQKTGVAYPKKPNYRRGKSALSEFGGL